MRILPADLNEELRRAAKAHASQRRNGCKVTWDPVPLEIGPGGQLSFAFNTAWMSFSAQEPSGLIAAIDGSDNAPVEFINGQGIGAYRYGWIIPDSPQGELQDISEIQIVRVDTLQSAWEDLEDFYWALFGGRRLRRHTGPGSLASLTVRKLAGFWRNCHEWLCIKDLLDSTQVGVKDIVLRDGPLRALVAPLPDFIDEVGQWCARRGVVLVGFQKSSKLNLIPYFQGIQHQGGQGPVWFRVPACVLRELYGQSRQVMTLGSTGRGIGVPIAVSFSRDLDQWYIAEFNVYDLQSYSIGNNLVKNPLPLTDRDQEFITDVLAQIAFYCDRLTCLGYPFPAGKIHNEVVINRSLSQYIQERYIEEMLSQGGSMKEMVRYTEDPHKIVEFY